MVHGSCLKAHGSWSKARGSRLSAHSQETQKNWRASLHARVPSSQCFSAPLARSLDSRALEPGALSHEPLTINNRWINKEVLGSMMSNYWSKTHMDQPFTVNGPHRQCIDKKSDWRLTHSYKKFELWVHNQTIDQKCTKEKQWSKLHLLDQQDIQWGIC